MPLTGLTTPPTPRRPCTAAVSQPQEWVPGCTYLRLVLQDGHRLLHHHLRTGSHGNSDRHPSRVSTEWRSTQQGWGDAGAARQARHAAAARSGATAAAASPELAARGVARRTLAMAGARGLLCSWAWAPLLGRVLCAAGAPLLGCTCSSTSAAESALEEVQPMPMPGLPGCALYCAAGTDAPHAGPHGRRGGQPSCSRQVTWHASTGGSNWIAFRVPAAAREGGLSAWPPHSGLTPRSAGFCRRPAGPPPGSPAPGAGRTPSGR